MSTANVLAASLVLMTGKATHAICVSCLHATDPHEEHYARMIPAGGDCELCSFSDLGFRGPRGSDSDMFVTTNPNLPLCPVQALTLHVVSSKTSRG